MQELGKRLKELRKKRGLTQEQLGNQIHKSKAAIGSYEQGIQTPPSDVLISLAKLYHISLDVLVGIEHGYCYSVESLSQSQREAIEMILDEFDSPTGGSGNLSHNQMSIINKLIRIFLDSPK